MLITSVILFICYTDSMDTSVPCIKIVHCLHMDSSNLTNFQAYFHLFETRSSPSPVAILLRGWCTNLVFIQKQVVRFIIFAFTTMQKSHEGKINFILI